MKKSTCMKTKAVEICVLALLWSSIGFWQESLMRDDGRWDAFVSNFIKSYFAIHPDMAVESGHHEFDGKLPDWSRAGIENEIKWLRAERQRALAFNLNALNKHRQFERDYLIAFIDGKLFWLTSAEWPYKNPRFYSDALNPSVYVAREYAPLAERMRAYIAYAKAVPVAVEHIRDNLRPPLPRHYVELGRNTFGGLASYYENDVPSVYSSIDDPKLKSEFRTANEAAVVAMRNMAAWFEAQRIKATDDFALGPERFREMLWATERADVSLQTLESTGRNDLDRNLAALQKACATYAPGKNTQECIATVQAKKPQGSLVQAAMRQLSNLRTFILEKDLVTIPGEGEVQVAEAPPYRRFNLAYIDTPFEKGLPSTYYISPPDPGWSEAERKAYIPDVATLMFISAHEVWPGHFLQSLHAGRSPSRLGQLLIGYAFTEGWAHYAEELMLEAGLGNGDPEIHIGQLLQALTRNVRFLSAIGLHTNRMTVAESERMFRELAYQDPGTARQQSARGTFDPAYLNYTMGKLMIRKLREDWASSRGGRKAWSAFHDQFLSFGRPPIPLVRAAMLGPDSGLPF